MKVLHLSKADSTGGAGRAAFRIHQTLRAQGVDSRILCLDQSRDDFHITGPKKPLAKALAPFRGVLDRLPVYLYRGRKTAMFHPQWLPDDIRSQVLGARPEIVHLHWIGGGFIRLEGLLRFKLPIVWTLHDMAAFTGGCHYSGDCARYRERCGRCPQLGSRRERDLSRWVWKRKKRVFGRLDLTIVSPSRWLARCARSSPLLRNRRIEVIPYTLDLDRFSPRHREWARAILGLPQDKRIILLGADRFFSVDRKGHRFIGPALRALEKRIDPRDVRIALFGASKPESGPDTSFRRHYFGTLSDDITIALLYAASDLFVTPAREDNLPLTVMESLASGTPVAAFSVGGIPEMVSHRKNGYLASPLDPTDLARGIAWVLEDRDRWEALSRDARRTAEDLFSSASITAEYTDIYEEQSDRFGR